MNAEQFKKAEEINRKITSINGQIKNSLEKGDNSIFCVMHVDDFVLDQCRDAIVSNLRGTLNKLELEFKNL